MPANYRITRIVSRLSGVANELQRLHFSGFQRPAMLWQPAMNVYLSEDRLDICLDLAGVDPGSIAIRLDGPHLTIEGTRPSPESQVNELRTSCQQILVMEIENGAFQRVLKLPVPVDEENIRAENKKGMLWIYLPTRRDPHARGSS